MRKFLRARYKHVILLEMERTCLVGVHALGKNFEEFFPSRRITFNSKKGFNVRRLIFKKN